MRNNKSLIVAAAASLWVALPAHAAVTLLGTGMIPGDAVDQSGLDYLLEDGVTPANQVGGLGSAIAYSPSSKKFFATPDRGPADGTTSYPDRLYQISLSIQQQSVYGTNAFSVTPHLQATHLLSTDGGRSQLTGDATAFDSTNSPMSLRFDPEGIRIDACGSGVYVSDEYGPFLYHFNLDGVRNGAVRLPHGLLIDAPSADAATELNQASGRQTNRGMEGLAISPDGSTLFGLMQSPLIQDGGLDSSNKRVGLNSRLIQVTVANGEIHEYLYRLDAAGNGLNEILAINDHEFLVIERDGKAGSSAVIKKIYKIDLSGATDIRTLKSMPATDLPAGVTPVSKSLFIDLLDPAYGLAGASFPEKIEGLAFGADLRVKTADGTKLVHTLVVTNDNDFVAANPNAFYVFGIEQAELPGYTQQTTQQCR
jgi:hypothetical protein